MASAVSICSNALLLLGDNPISAFDEGTDKATLAGNLWETVRDDMLRSHPWNCAVKRTTLAADSTAPAYDYAFRYLLPTDWMRTISVGEYGAEPDHKSEGRYILCDESPLYLRYIYRNTDPNTYDASLIAVLTLAMAARMAYAVTSSASMQQTLAQELQQALRRARAIDGQDDPPETIGDFRLLSSRY
jgi:hypothetical protein